MFIAEPGFNQRLNDMSFWFPIVEDIARYSEMPDVRSGRDTEGKIKLVEVQKDFVLRVPKTEMFYASHEIAHIADGVKTPAFDKLVADVGRAHEAFGGESFLRTGQTSNKHEWDSTCHLTKSSKIGNHLYSLIEFSMMVDIPYTTFVVREMIPTAAITVAFRNMPITREVRMFVGGGKVLCAHPYWPAEAFDEQDVTQEDIEKLQEMPDMEELNKLGEYVSNHFALAWSVDFLQDVSGNWWLTDMALAKSSYHYPGCEVAS